STLEADVELIVVPAIFVVIPIVPIVLVTVTHMVGILGPNDKGDIATIRAGSATNQPRVGIRKEVVVDHISRDGFPMDLQVGGFVLILEVAEVRRWRITQTRAVLTAAGDAEVRLVARVGAAGIDETATGQEVAGRRRRPGAHGLSTECQRQCASERT